MNTESNWTRGHKTVHLLAVLAMVATLGLLYAGGLVTSHEVGMAVPDWPTTFNENMFTYQFLDKSFGIILEHSHRLFASGVGLITLLLGAAIYRWERRVWVRWLGLAAVIGVIVQGVLGGQRVTLNEWAGQDLAALHGCVGQAFFALTVVVATVTSRTWQFAPSIPSFEAVIIRRLSFTLAGMVYLQIVLGALVRHYHGWGWMVHMSLALGIFFAAMWLAMLLFLEPAVRQALGAAGVFLIGALVAQIVLGFLTLVWTGVLDPASHTMVTNREAIITTTHLALGSILLGVSVYLSVSAARRLALPRESSPRQSSLHVMESMA